jgi:hypothetical protein
MGRNDRDKDETALREKVRYSGLQEASMAIVAVNEPPVHTGSTTELFSFDMWFTQMCLWHRSLLASTTTSTMTSTARTPGPMTTHVKARA